MGVFYLKDRGGLPEMLHSPSVAVWLFAGRNVAHTGAVLYVCKRMINLISTMVIREIGKRLMGFVAALTLGLMCLSASRGIGGLDHTDLEWKNVRIDGKKVVVFNLFADSQGLMWVGTNSGLYFYDGVNAHAVGRDGMFGTQVYAIVEKDLRLYIGSNNGLSVYNYLTGRAAAYEGASAGEMPKEIRSLLLVDDDLWIGSLYGAYRLNLKDGRLTDLSAGLPHKSVYCLLRDARGVVYAGTYNGLARWNTAVKRFDAVKATCDGKPLSTLFVNCLLESPDGQSIYLGSEGALYNYAPVNEAWRRVRALDGNNVKSLARTAMGHLLVGTNNGVFDLDSLAVRHYHHDSRMDGTLSDNEVWCILSDANNNVWAGHERGFSIASNSSVIHPVKLSTLVHSGEGNEIYSIFRDRQGSLWLGGTNGVIRIAPDGQARWYRHSEAPHALSHNRIRAIRQDGQQLIWLATDGGINRFDAATDGFDVFHVVDSLGGHASNWVYALEEEGPNLWVGCYLGGLHCVEKSKFNQQGGVVTSDRVLNAEQGLPNDFVSDLVVDGKGNLWMLLFRDNCLHRLHTATGEMERYDIEALTGSSPSHICLDGTGALWCSFKGGVIVFQADGTSRLCRFPQTGSDESVLALARVGEEMWVSTLSNVWSVRVSDLQPMLLPIPPKGYTAMMDDERTGNVLLGGVDELAEVDRSKLGAAEGYKAINMILYRQDTAYVDMLSHGGSPKELTVRHGGSVTLVVSTLDYSPETAQRYAYTLSSSPTDATDSWVMLPEGVNEIVLTNLSMGHYNLLVKTVGSPLPPVTVALAVSAPVYLSWWAVLLYLIILVAVVFAIVYSYRRRSLRQRQEEERKKTIAQVERKLTFLSNISHDLKTPLSMILGPVSLLKEKERDSERRHSLEMVYDNAVKLNTLIHRTLELNHLSDDDEDLLIQSTFDVVEFCRGICDTFKENYRQKNFLFHASCPQLLIEADAVKFESVITNLLSNACKYSGEGATVTCGITRYNDRVEITVADDGVGIAEADQSLVFQRMFRSQSTAKQQDGSGIGLYLVKRYVELMHGTVNLYSKEGQGTSISITLPIADQSVSTEAETAVEAADTDRPKILVVDDNKQISSFVVSLLKGDYTVLTAENGRVGLAIASSFVPDLLVVDEMMPVMSGLEMCRQLKQNPRLASIPIIMLTAKDDPATENASIQLGIDVFMGKPFEPKPFLARIKQLLQSRAKITEGLRIKALTEVKPIEAESAVEKQLAKIAETVEANIANPDLNVNLLCEKCGIPNKQLYRIIKKHIGLSPLDYIRTVRLQKAAMLLGQHHFTVSEVSYMVGFNTPSYFAKCFQSMYGVQPSAYRPEADEGKCRS